MPRTLSQKLVLYIVAATCALLIATIAVSYDAARHALEQQTNTEAVKQVQSTAVTLDSYVDRVAVLVDAIEARQEASDGGTPQTPFRSFPICSTRLRPNRPTAFTSLSKIRMAVSWRCPG